ncbi:Amiloride-sensitive sodium channel subunit beta [Amphibalanus amphitrite]|uniref:Amiloride-sensitive sodium channel subunit beta n=1 Tax=Amphibalanus amphitrite TaxID=1232801 RepID=A0A6A4VRR6_AMPAM|nr:Amiloride-sensitive sodium channel subunit beta [Amphibalanus amphitrite]
MTARVSVGRVLKDTGRQYWGRTGVGGLSNAYSADWRPQRLIWLVLFAIGLVMTVMDVVDVIEDYYAFPHSTQMEVVYDRSANFPAVTVCSQSKIDCRRLLSTSLGEPDNGHISKLLNLFRTTSSAEYGNCFTFNSNVTETSDPLAGQRVTGLTGQQYSLDLLLDLNHHTFPPVTATKGARVQVHQPDQQPDVEDSGLSVMPNVATSIAIEQRCQKMCLQSLFIERCDCQHAKYPSPLTFRKHGKPLLERIRPCLLTVKGNDTECTNSIQQKFDNGDVTCHCPSACFERSFNTFQSNGRVAAGRLPGEYIPHKLGMSMVATASYSRELSTLTLISGISYCSPHAPKRL